MRKRNVVLLEIDPQVAGAYELFLASRGFEVTVASTVSAAMRALSSSVPEVVVIGDIPDTVDASAVAERVRVMVAPHPLSVVVMSPNMDEIPGADLVIPRGAHPRAVVDAMRTVMRRRPVTAPIATAS